MLLSLSLAFADAPVSVPVQGALMTDGSPVSGEVLLTFRLDDADPQAGPYLLTEVATVTIVNGEFAALLHVDPAVLDTPDLTLSVQVGAGAFSDPVPVGWAPRAVVAARLTASAAAAFRPATWVPAWGDLTGDPSANQDLADLIAGAGLSEAEVRAALLNQNLSVGTGGLTSGSLTTGAVSAGAVTATSFAAGNGLVSGGRLQLSADTSTVCNAGTAGMIRWNGTTFQGCVGAAWISFGSTDGLTAASAAPSCKFIKDNFNQATGTYWIDVDGSAGAAAPFQTQCDMTTNGGGWTRISTGGFYSGANAYLVFDGRGVAGTSLWLQHKSGETRCNTTGVAPNAWAGCNAIGDGACGFVIFNGSSVIYDAGDYNACRDNGGFTVAAARPAFGDRFLTRSTSFSMGANSQLAYWEDWNNTSEADNGGQHYVDVWIR